MKKGDFIEFDGLLAVVVGIEGDDDVPEDHVALWFGDIEGRRSSAGGTGGRIPEVWTVPSALCAPAKTPIFRH